MHNQSGPILVFLSPTGSFVTKLSSRFSLLIGWSQISKQETELFVKLTENRNPELEFGVGYIPKLTRMSELTTYRCGDGSQ
jgi:hypothetical protein